MTDVDYKSPMYLQLREIVRARIEDGEYAPGAAIPSENELAETYGINRLTVRNAIDTLVKEGLLKRVQGKGVYVVGKKVERDLNRLEGFTRTMLDKKVMPTPEIVTKAVRAAGGRYAALFDIDAADEVYYVKRVDYADDEPCSLEEILVPKYVVPKLEGIDLSVFSLYEVYGFYGIGIARVEQTMELTTLEQSDARTLGITVDYPVLRFSSTTYDENGRVIEYTRNYSRTDKCSFTVHFTL